MSSPVYISAETKAEAAAWLARLRADDRSVADERAFQIWLKASPANAAAFEAVNLIWETSGALSRADRGVLESERAPSRVSRRAVMAGLGTLAVIGGSAAFVMREAYAGVYETDVGEQKHVTLDDGTQVFLDTDTRIKVSYSDKARVVDLQRGRANFRVAPDVKRSFVVEAAKKRIVAGRTILDVRRDGERVSVVLIQGSASVEGSKARQTLTAGQRLVSSSNGGPTLDQPNMTQQLAWQTGQAIFDNQSLAEAVAEMNRYSSIKLKIADRGIGVLRMSGVYRVGDNAAFAHSVAKLLPIEVRAAGDSLELVADLTRTPQG